MRKIILVLAVLVLLTSCGKPDKTTGLINPGKLQVGVEIGYAPMEFYSDDGITPYGFDVDLSKLLAEDMGLKVVYSDTEWDGIFSGLDIDKYDVIISGVTRTPERDETTFLSNSYVRNRQVLITKSDSKLQLNDIMDVEGLKVGFQTQTTSDIYLSGLIDTGVLHCEREEYDKIMNVFDDLQLNRIDAVLVDGVVAHYYMDKYPGAFRERWSQPESEDPEEIVVVIKKGNQVLLDKVNTSLDNLEKNGKLPALRDKWFGSAEK